MDFERKRLFKPTTIFSGRRGVVVRFGTTVAQAVTVELASHVAAAERA